MSMIRWRHFKFLYTKITYLW